MLSNFRGTRSGSAVVPPAVSAVLSALAVFALSCSSDSSTKPVDVRYELSGRVRLVSNLFNLSGAPTGTRLVDDAGGVPVYLSASGGIVDSTHTLHGTYTFGNLAPGVYQVRSHVLPDHPVRLADLTLGDRNLLAADTLILGPVGDMRTSPNPSEPEGFGVEFTTEGPQPFAITILDLHLEEVWSFAGTSTDGFNHFHWDGHRLDEHAAPEGAYWVLLRLNGTEAFNLAFWTPAIEPPSAGNCGHIEADGFLVQRGGSVLASEWRGTQRGVLDVAAGSSIHGLELRFLRADSTAYAIADTCPENRLTWTIADSSVVSLELEPGRRWAFDLVGKRAGSTTVILHGWHEEHIHFNSLPIPVVIAQGVPTSDFHGQSSAASGPGAPSPAGFVPPRPAAPGLKG